MKRILILMIIVFSAATNTMAQELNDISVIQYVDWSRKLVSEADHLEKLQQQVLKLQQTCDELRSSWKKTCMDYLNASGRKYTDNLDYLIQNTDPAFDGQELYDALLKARESAVERETRRYGDPVHKTDPEKKDGGYLDERMLKKLK